MPTQQFVRTLNAARLAADVLDVPTVLVARTDALSAALLTSDVDEYDREFVTGERTAEGFFRVRDGIDAAISRGLAYAPYADLIWCETSTPDLDEAREFAEAIHEKFPGKLLAYNCSPSFNWRKHLDDETIARFQDTARRVGLQVPVHHARRLPLAERGDVRARARLRRERDDVRTSSCRSTSSRSRSPATPRRGTSARSAPATSTSSRRRSRRTSSTLALKGSTEEAQFTGAG